MADYIKVMKEYERMCRNYPDCNGCPLQGLNCEHFLHKHPETSESTIMEWARKHSPFYPTIGEVIEEICRLMNIHPKTNLNTIYDERLTKEAADRFNIKPH